MSEANAPAESVAGPSEPTSAPGPGAVPDPVSYPIGVLRRVERPIGDHSGLYVRVIVSDDHPAPEVGVPTKVRIPANASFSEGSAPSDHPDLTDLRTVVTVRREGEVTSVPSGLPCYVGMLETDWGKLSPFFDSGGEDFVPTPTPSSADLLRLALYSQESTGRELSSLRARVDALSEDSCNSGEPGKEIMALKVKYEGLQQLVRDLYRNAHGSTTN